MTALLDLAITHLQSAKYRWQRGDRTGTMAAISACDRALRQACRVYVEVSTWT